MANNKNNNQKKKQPKYSNPDPMSNVRDMGRYGIRVIRDIAKGKFNFYNEGHIFRNLDFTRATIDEVSRKIFEASAHVNAMNACYGQSSDPRLQELIMKDMRTLEAYQLVYDTLWTIVNQQGDTRYLQILITKLPRYKYNM